MPRSLSARKRMRQSQKRRLRNRSVRSATKTHVKRFFAAAESGDLEAAQAAHRTAVRALDKAVSRGVIHRRTAARHKSRLAARLHRLTTPSPPS